MPDPPATEPLSYKGTRVAVTGAGGFLGRHLVKELVRLGAQITPLDRSSQVDLLSPASIQKALVKSRPAVVFHLAGSLLRGNGRDEALQNFAVNVSGTHNLLDGLSQFKPSPLCVLAGTADVYGSAEAPFREDQAPAPLSSYAASKLAAWHWARCFPGTRALEARLFLLYGPDQDQRFFIPQLLRSCETTQPLAMTAGAQTRDFVWVEDAVKALLRLGLRPDLQGQSFNVCTGQETSLRQVVELVSELCGKPLGAGLGQLPYREGELFRLFGDPTLLEQRTGFRPTTTLRDGIRTMIGGQKCR